MILLIIGHLLGDFYFQTDKMVLKKKETFGHMLWHGFVYSVVVLCVLTLLGGDFIKYVMPILIIGILHIVVDTLKIKIQKKWINKPKGEGILFIMDQGVHIIILWLISQFWIVEANIDWIQKLIGIDVSLINHSLIVIAAMLFCGKPAAIVVDLVFKFFPVTIETADIEKEHESSENKKENQEQILNQERIRIGSLIGVFEREIILILGLLGQYAAIGFVLTAKSIARYSQLNKKHFAEKYLLGTLLSAFLAIVCVGICTLQIKG